MEPGFREWPAMTGVARPSARAHGVPAHAPKSCSAGFTLLELIITVMVIALLATVVFPMAEVAATRSQEQKLRAALFEIRHAIDAYKQAASEGKVEGVPDATSTVEGAKIFFLRRIPRDPMATDSSVAAEETWGKRSYASSPDEPEEGDDVFDVYTRATGVGLNGIPYRQW
jgi:general secretion pathway protein G